MNFAPPRRRVAQDASRFPVHGIFGVFRENTKTDPENILEI
jgi:hypothetical protein